MNHTLKKPFYHVDYSCQSICSTKCYTLTIHIAAIFRDVQA